MKKANFLKTLGYIVFSICFLISCSKNSSSKSRCPQLGGVIEYEHYLFWINHDPQDVITVEVKDDDGNVVSTFYPQTSVYYPTGQPANCDADKNARFDLGYGRDYSYKATTSTGLSWSGQIQTPCDAGQCELIELK